MEIANPVRVQFLPDTLLLREARPTVPWRVPLWAAFLGLTTLILGYPVNFSLEPFIIWSPDIFPNLPLFGALFHLWAALLVVLLFPQLSPSVALPGVFTAVTIGIATYCGPAGSVS